MTAKVRCIFCRRVAVTRDGDQVLYCIGHFLRLRMALHMEWHD